MTDKKMGTMIRARDPETLEMEYAIGLKEDEARRLKDLLQAKNFEAMKEDHGDEPWSRVIAKLDWVLETAESDRKLAEERAAKTEPDEVP